MTLPHTHPHLNTYIHLFVLLASDDYHDWDDMWKNSHEYFLWRMRWCDGVDGDKSKLYSNRDYNTYADIILFYRAQVIKMRSYNIIFH